MKRTTKIILALILSYGFGPALFAQSTPAGATRKETRQIQPTIMVIPFTKENEDLRTILDSFVTLRVAIVKMQEAFNERGFTTVDFRAKANATKTDNMYKGMNQQDLKTRLIEASGADIYVEVEANQQTSSSGNSVRLIINSYDAFTGRNMGSKTSESGKWYTDNFDGLVEKCIFKKNGDKVVLLLEEFLNTMQSKFDEIKENGRAIKVIFGLSANSGYDFDTEIAPSGDQLKDVVEDWIEANAYRNVYHFQGSTDKEMIFDEVYIPLRDEMDKNFTPSKFTRLVRKFCNSLSPADDPDAKLKVDDSFRGGTIYITLK